VLVTDDHGTHHQLKFKKAVLATGARAAAPPLPGLETISYLTNETLFSLTELPPRLGIVGGGPIGSEMAQAFTRFGSRVSLFEKSPRILAREDADASEVVQAQFLHEGVELVLNAESLQFARTATDGVQIQGSNHQGPFDVTVDQCLVAVGRAPNVEGLHLERAGVEFGSRGVTVNDHLQTTNPRVFACGDICSSAKFTHAADFQARIVIQNALFALGPFGRARASKLLIPWATYTSPELAHVGLYPEQAAERGIAIETYKQEFRGVDRAILDGDVEGFVKVHVRQGSDQLVGATVVSPHAGDLIAELTLAMTHGLGLGKIGSTIHPYPTHADAIRKLGDQFRRTQLTPFSRRVLDWLRRRNVGP
ncbi:MAG: FAD-dependent oxidoreductase, partial [Planctomycetota bacterium]